MQKRDRAKETERKRVEAYFTLLADSKGIPILLLALLVSTLFDENILQAKIQRDIYRNIEMSVLVCKYLVNIKINRKIAFR